MLRLSIDQLACHHSGTERGQQPEEMGHKTPPPTEAELSTGTIRDRLPVIDFLRGPKN
jgi:hypothetical protein